METRKQLPTIALMLEPIQAKRKFETDKNTTFPLFHPYSMRLHMLLMMCACVYCGTYMKANLGVGVVCMINKTALTVPKQPVVYLHNISQIHPIHSEQDVEVQRLAVCRVQRQPHITSFMQASTEKDIGEESGPDGPFKWTSMEQSQLFSSLFYGNMITIGFSGWLADSYSPKALLTFAICTYSLLNLLTPWLASANYFVYLAARFIMGLGDGLIFPVVASMVARWFPACEKSTAAAIYSSGLQLAATIGVMVSTRLCTFDWVLADGWPNIFYYGGVSGVIWLILWVALASNSPYENRYISEKEKLFLKNQLSSMPSGNAKKYLFSKGIPWRSMILSPATQSVILCQFSFNFSNTLLQGFTPLYFRDVLLLDLNSDGVYTATPFVTQLVFKLIFALLADHLKKSGRLGGTAACKILQTLSGGGAGLTLFLMAFFVNCETPMLSIVLLAVFGVCFAGSVAGAFTSALCIAPPFTGTISSLSLLSGAFGNIAITLLVGYVKQTSSHYEWKLIFSIAAGVNLLTGIFFLIFGTAEVQAWAMKDSYQKENLKNQIVTTALPKKKDEIL